jgi:hypothetical protein
LLERSPHLVETDELDFGLARKAWNYEVNSVPAAFLVRADEPESTAVQSFVEVGR